MNDVDTHSEYTLQVEREVTLDGTVITAWVDVGSVLVSRRVKRKSAIREALMEGPNRISLSHLEEFPEDARVRVLDAESAFAFTVTLESEPQLRIA